MILEAQIAIHASAAAVWNVISDIENAPVTIRGIEQVEILDHPEQGLVGLKWRETRALWGETATEEICIMEAVDGQFYRARAASHGCISITTLSISESKDRCVLTMHHDIQPQAIVAKLLSPFLGCFLKKRIRKILLQDLGDIKRAVERPRDVEIAANRKNASSDLSGA